MNKPETVLITGPSCCGKTHALLHEPLENGYRGHFDYIDPLSNSLVQFDLYHLEVPRKRYRYNRPWYRTGHSRHSAAAHHRRVYRHPTRYHHRRHVEQHNNHNSLSYLGYSGRHHNFTPFEVSQKLNSIATGITPHGWYTSSHTTGEV